MNDQFDPREQALQAQLDAGKPTPDIVDARAYHALYAALSTSPARLSSSFAYEAMLRAWRHRRQQDARTPLLSLVLLAVTIAAGLASLYVVSSLGFAPGFDWHTIDSVINALAPVRFVALGIFLLVILDAMLSRYRTR